MINYYNLLNITVVLNYKNIVMQKIKTKKNIKNNIVIIVNRN